MLENTLIERFSREVEKWNDERPSSESVFDDRICAKISLRKSTRDLTDGSLWAALKDEKGNNVAFNVWGNDSDSVFIGVPSALDRLAPAAKVLTPFMRLHPPIRASNQGDRWKQISSNHMRKEIVVEVLSKVFSPGSASLVRRS